MGSSLCLIPMTAIGEEDSEIILQSYKIHNVITNHWLNVLKLQSFLVTLMHGTHKVPVRFRSRLDESVPNILETLQT